MLNNLELDKATLTVLGEGLRVKERGENLD